MSSYGIGSAQYNTYAGRTMSVTPTAPNPPTGAGSKSASLWQSSQPPGGELVHGNYAVQGRPAPMRSVPGSEYTYIPAVPSSAAPPAQPTPPLSAIGSVAGAYIANYPPITGPAVPAKVVVGNVFA